MADNQPKTQIPVQGVEPESGIQYSFVTVGPDPEMRIYRLVFVNRFLNPQQQIEFPLTVFTPPFGWEAIETSNIEAFFKHKRVRLGASIDHLKREFCKLSAITNNRVYLYLWSRDTSGASLPLPRVN